jgi:hypothetical protein
MDKVGTHVCTDLFVTRTTTSTVKELKKIKIRQRK